MSMEKIHLRKLLQLIYAPTNLRRTLLREEIRREIAKRDRKSSSGGDFHAPFWSDAKDHIRGKTDLLSATSERISRNRRKQRLYPELARGFLQWWNENRRWRNEEFRLIGEEVSARFQIPELGCVVKVENLLAVNVDGQFDRIVYPYFSEAPTLGEEATRVGLWVMQRSLVAHRLEDMRILDVLRARAFGTIDYSLHGDEGAIFHQQYRTIHSEWAALWVEYE